MPLRFSSCALLVFMPASGAAHSAEPNSIESALPVADRYAALWSHFSISDFEVSYELGKRIEGWRIGATNLAEELRLARQDISGDASTRLHLVRRWQIFDYMRARRLECEQLIESLTEHAKVLRNNRSTRPLAEKTYAVVDEARPICRQLDESQRAFELEMFQRLLEADHKLSTCAAAPE